MGKILQTESKHFLHLWWLADFMIFFFKIQIKRKLLVISCLKDDYVEIKHNYASSVNHSVILFFL